MKTNSGKRKEARKKGQALFACGKGAAPSRGTRRGQVSMELIMMIAAMLAFALILAVQLQKTAQEGRDTLKNNSNKVFDAIDDIGKLAKTPSPKLKNEGESCSKNSDCNEGLTCLYDVCE